MMATNYWPCLHSKHLRSSRNEISGRKKEFSHLDRAENRARTKKVEGGGWGRVFVVTPFSARPSRGPLFCSARTGKGTLATQAIIGPEQAGQILVDEYISVF